MSMDKDDLRKECSFGKDFITYICYMSDKNAGVIMIPGSDDQFLLWLDGRIVLADDREPPPNTVSYSGDDFTVDDLRQAIRSGKKVREARLRIEQGANVWSFNFKAERFEVSSLKIDMPQTNDMDERFFDRMLSIEALNGLLDQLYEYFIGEVYEKKWQVEGYPEFQTWLNKSI